MQHHDSLQRNFHLPDTLTTSLRSASDQPPTLHDKLLSLSQKSPGLRMDLNKSKPLSLIKLMCYVKYLSPSELRVASTVKFTPGDSLVNFGAKIGKKKTK